jgi:hypothetical protein
MDGWTGWEPDAAASTAITVTSCMQPSWHEGECVRVAPPCAIFGESLASHSSSQDAVGLRAERVSVRAWCG